MAVDGDEIEPDQLHPLVAAAVGEPLRRARETGDSLGPDGLGRAPGTPRLDLDHGQRAPVARDDVDLAGAAHARVAGEHPAPAQPHEPGRERLAPVSEGVRPGHQASSSESCTAPTVANERRCSGQGP